MKHLILIAAVIISFSVKGQYKVMVPGVTETELKAALVERGFPIQASDSTRITTFARGVDYSKANRFDIRLVANKTSNGYEITGEYGWHNRHWIVINDEHVTKGSRSVMDEFAQYVKNKGKFVTK